ncbi:hypothetical protein FACS189451_09230 [Bacteroidia bacterium]|nr:hypothetical protein FACS189446_6160 [Bacteroidia bacterium]GHT63120.1 hypothetical protein FACS189451_09230 [Bacteroidia bacterium]
MNTRLLEFIQYKTDGHQADFAEIMGWSPQYLYKLLKGDGGIGIRPIVALLEKFQELNARWLLLGEGGMISTGADKVKMHLLQLLEIEKYMPVMSPDELRELENGRSNFDEETIERWENLLNEKNNKIQARFDAAYKKQNELCNQKPVKK